jgi:type I restriction enzyme S subunit
VIWKTVSLAEVANVGAGNSAPQEEYLFENGSHNFYRTSDVGRIRTGVISESSDKLNSKGIKGLKLHPVGTILFPKSGASTFLNHRVMLAKEGYVSSHLATIKAKSLLADDKFLLYFLTTIDAKNLVQDSNYPSLKTSTIEKIVFSLPPLSIQQKIAKRLDEIYAEIDKALVASEVNTKNAESLFQNYLTEVFDKNIDFKNYKLDDVVTRLTNGYVGATKNIYLDYGIPYLLARHVKNNVLKFDNRTFISEDFNIKNKKSILKKDDVLLVQSGHIGHSAVVPIEHEGHNCHAMIVISTVKEILSGEYLSLYFQSNKMKILFEEMKTGSTIKHLNCGDVKQLMIPIPPIEKQKKIITEAKRIENLVSFIKNRINEKITQLNFLRKSILRQAFNGELVKE